VSTEARHCWELAFCSICVTLVWRLALKAGHAFVRPRRNLRLSLTVDRCSTDGADLSTPPHLSYSDVLIYFLLWFSSLFSPFDWSLSFSRLLSLRSLRISFFTGKCVAVLRSVNHFRDLFESSQSWRRLLADESIWDLLCSVYRCLVIGAKSSWTHVYMSHSACVMYVCIYHYACMSLAYLCLFANWSEAENFTFTYDTGPWLLELFLDMLCDTYVIEHFIIVC